MAGEHYSAFVEEAFVKPIRSVLIVDDDYPTFDEMLDAEIARNGQREHKKAKDWYNDPARIKKVIASFRIPGRALLVDIHDGTNVSSGAEIKIAAHLHQSDLLVLDYQLDKAKPGDGALAIEIIRSLMSNDHFNLVVVHTSENLETVFRETLISLMAPLVDRLEADDSQRAQTLLIEAEDKADGIGDRLSQSVGIDQYVHARRFHGSYLRIMSKSQQPYSAFRAECDQLEWESDDRKLVLRYLLEQVDLGLAARFNVGSDSQLDWDDGGSRYIKTNTVFIAFSQKNNDDDLLSELLAALNAWNPRPSRLFLAKLRAEMDEYGVMAQSAVLDNLHALAHWYRRLLASEGPDRRWLITESVARHSEQLMNGILPRVENFAGRLIAAEAKTGVPETLSKEHFSIDLTNAHEKLKAEYEHNAFVSSKPPEGWHLTTGQVFVVGQDYWVCVSPACDTVPAQLSAGRVALFGERLPFMAVKLIPVADGKVLKDVQTNRYVFLRVAGGVKCFCFNDPSSDASAPAWHMLYAEKRGIFSKDFNFKLSITEKGTRRLLQRKCDAQVVCQLRYEYALNLVQRLGGSLTRIGLDFV
ncbi:response regulator receiver domain [Mesorhizobium sp. M0854]|uniref:response regulator receiver domain n=1 Tax=Mesorhizobium sp. M0854 TaxID=2957013 RepID=UPI00333C4E74